MNNKKLDYLELQMEISVLRFLTYLLQNISNNYFMKKNYVIILIKG
jgi:hypothetical protein